MMLLTSLLLVLPSADPGPEAGEPGGPGLAIRCAKALVVDPDPARPQVVDRAWVVVRDGKIESVTAAAEGEPPADCERIDVGDNWCMPGLVELHSHVGGTFDINDMVYLAQPGLSSRVAIVPNNPALKTALAAGVTTVLFIPGSGVNIGGMGVLFKTGIDRYEEALVRDPGSLKLAQWGNPEAWAIGVGMAFENWNTRDTFRRGLAYARRWENHEGDVPVGERQLHFDVFRDLLARRTQVSTHTQVYQVVLMTLTMIKKELGVDVYLDHSTIGGWLTGALAQELGVPAIVGPRSVDTPSRGFIEWAHTGYEGFRGVAAGYQERGLEDVGFNTDSPVIPQETLQLQAGVGVRYGFDDSRAQAVRGLTVVPAMAAGISDRVGTLLPGRDADVVVISGHPADPRSHVDWVLVNGKRVYDSSEGRRW